MLRKINLNKEKNLVPQGGTEPMYHTLSGQAQSGQNQMKNVERAAN